MTLGVKHCGGCNPRFDRAGLVSRLQQDFPGLEVVYLQQGAPVPDFTLDISGCSRRCAADRLPEGRRGGFSLADADEYPALAAALQALRQGE